MYALLFPEYASRCFFVPSTARAGEKAQYKFITPWTKSQPFFNKEKRFFNKKRSFFTNKKTCFPPSHKQKEKFRSGSLGIFVHT